MKTWVIPVEWTVCGRMEIDAKTLEEAIDIACLPETPLPDGDYLMDSFIVSYGEDIIRSDWNDNQEDESEEDDK